MNKNTVYASALALGTMVALASADARAKFEFMQLNSLDFSIEQKLFIDQASENKDGVNSFFGSVGSNSGTDKVKIDTNQNVKTGNGWANIKPYRDDSARPKIGNILYDFTFTPVSPLKLEDIFFRFQAEGEGVGEGGVAIVKLSVNGGSTLGADLFTFDDFKADADEKWIGIVASGLDTIETLKVWIEGDTNNPGFKEVKQIAVSLKTTPVPVPAALPIIGAALAGFGFAGWRTQRKAA